MVGLLQHTQIDVHCSIDIQYMLYIIFLTAPPPPPCIPSPVQSGHAPEVASRQPKSFHSPLSVKLSIPTPHSTTESGDPSPSIPSKNHGKVMMTYIICLQKELVKGIGS